MWRDSSGSPKCTERLISRNSSVFVMRHPNQIIHTHTSFFTSGGENDSHPSSIRATYNKSQNSINLGQSKLSRAGLVQISLRNLVRVIGRQGQVYL